LFTGVVLQLASDLGVIAGWFTGTGALSYALLLGSQVVVLAWVLANWQLPGLVLVALGLAMNAVVMAANGAMPVHPEAIAALGRDASELVRGKHVLADADTRLWWLADIWAVPPIRSVISIGDVVLAAGLIPIVHHLMTYRTAAERRTPRAEPSVEEPSIEEPSVDLDAVALDAPSDTSAATESGPVDDSAPASGR
jgi:hypothetical protein